MRIARKHPGADIEGFHFVSDVLCKYGDGKRVAAHLSRVVVPSSMREDLMYATHDCPLSGHLRCERTLSRLECKYWWPGMAETVKQWCESCQVCNAKGKHPDKPARVRALRMSVTPNKPFHDVAFDCMDR